MSRLKRKLELNQPLREALVYFGPDYTTKVIDRELCLYRNLNNGRDIEVSGLRSEGQRGRICNYICVWAYPGTNNERGPLEYIRSHRSRPTPGESVKLETLADLKRELDALVEKYGGGYDNAGKMHRPHWKYSN